MVLVQRSAGGGGLWSIDDALDCSDPSHPEDVRQGEVFEGCASTSLDAQGEGGLSHVSEKYKRSIEPKWPKVAVRETRVEPLQQS